MVGIFIFQPPFVVDGDVDEGVDDDEDAEEDDDSSSVVANVTHSGHPVVVSGNASKPNRIRRQDSSTSTLLQLA